MISEDLRNTEIHFDYESATFQAGELEPYEYLDTIREVYGELTEQQELNKMSEYAKKNFEITNFKTLYNAYKRDLSSVGNNKTVSEVGKTNFTGQEIELNTTWKCDDDGIRKGNEVACSHPIMITRRFLNTKTDEMKIELSYKIMNRWRTRIIDRTMIATGRDIVKLAKYGISVTIQNSDNLIEYLQELEELNSNIPLVQSVTRLGWIDEKNFIPYSSEVFFDGEREFKQLFDSVNQVGSKTDWIHEMQKLRQKDQSISMVIAGALASPLLEWISALPGFIHVWSGISGSGKTVLAMIAASCFGNPDSGHYMQSFNSTIMAQEKKAGVLYNCPFIIDESQLNTGKYSVYFLAAGQGKARGRADGSVAPVDRWCNTIISTGEKPLVTRSDGQGAFARVIEIEVKDILFEFEEGSYLADFLKENYGHAGPLMIEAMKQTGKEELRKKHIEYSRELKRINPNLQEKQVMFGAAILLAEELATNFIFNDDANEKGLTIKYVASCLKTDADSSISERAYNETIDWIAQNQSKFQFDTKSFEVYGVEEGNRIYIIRSVFNKFMDENNYSDRAVLSEWNKNNLIETYTEPSTGKIRFDNPKRINEQLARCICLKVVQDEQEVTTVPLF